MAKPAISSERATHFRAQAARLRWLADVEQDAQLKETLVELAGEYREMADSLDEDPHLLASGRADRPR